MLKVIKYMVIIIISMLLGAGVLALVSYKWYFDKYDKPEFERFGKYPLPIKKEIPLWEKKLPLKNQNIKFGLITDTHVMSKRLKRFGPETEVYMPDKYKKVFLNFQNEMKTFNPEFIVHLGDIIDGTGASVAKGSAELSLVKQELDKINKPVYWVAGNHDLRAVARRQFEKSLEIKYTNKSIDNGPFRFVILDASYNKKGGVPQNPVAKDYVPGFVPKETLTWLEKQLQTDKHVYIFMHQSLIPQKYTSKPSVSNSKEVRQLLSKYHVEAVFNGHIEKRFFGEVDGVKYYSLVGSKKSPRYPGTYYDVTIIEGKPQLEMFYIDPLTDKLVKKPFIEENEMVSPSKVEKTKTDELGNELPRKCEYNNGCKFEEICRDNICKDVGDLRKSILNGQKN